MAVTLTWVRDHYDTIVKDRYIDADERKNAVIDNINGIITQEELLAVMDAYDNQTQLPAYDTGTETKTTSLSEGNHDIQISLFGYDPLVAVINVSSTAVSCVSVVGGACGGSGLPRLATSGWTVTAYMKEGTGTTARCTWIATKDTSKVAFISEMVLAYNNLMNIGFTPTADEIGKAVLMYSNLGTPASLWGC